MKMRLLLLLFFITAFIFQSFSQTLFINEVMSSNASSIKDEDGDQPDWIEFYNATSGVISLNGYGLSDDISNKFKWVFESVNINAHSYLLVFASGKDRRTSGENLHTNFKLAKEGDTLTLVNTSGLIVDELLTGSIPFDVSRGRKPDGSNSFVFFSNSTPGTSNNNSTSYVAVLDTPKFSAAGGFYSGSLNLGISTITLQSKIYYTVDGSEPTQNSTLYSSPISLNKVTVVRAKAFLSGYIPSATATNTYLVNEHSTMPVISISTNPENLWDEQTGIYVKGDSASPVFPYDGANFWQDWEKPIHIEMYESTGEPAFSQDAGIRIYGGWTRAFDQKSLAIYARDTYGEDRFKYKLFSNRSTDKFKSFILRDGGQDWESLMMRDPLMQSLVEETELDIQAYRPAIVFLNGEYWGIHDIREKINEDYLAEHHNVDPHNVDFLKLDYEPLEGDNIHYMALLDYLNSHDISVSANYEYVKTQMDVKNFMKYCVTEIYIDNGDWPGSNIQYWRPRTPGGKWKWILYDTDYGFGLYDSTAYKNNTLQMATEPNGPEWPNPAWSTFLLRKLLTNQEFKYDFINYFADYSNSLFAPDTVVKKINIIRSIVEPEIGRHQVRWGRTLSQWQENLPVLYSFANNRLSYMRTHFLQQFGIPGMSNITVNVSDPLAGSVEINSLKAPNYPWTGRYFNIPIKLTANPKNGYHFVGWSGITAADSQEIHLTLGNNLSVTALFAADTGLTGTVVINEINYNSAPDFDPGNWVELYNQGNNTLDVSGWTFKDDNDSHSFVLPHNTFIQPKNYLVLCESDSAFKVKFPDVVNYIGNFDFALDNGGELIRLYDVQMNLVDALTYNDKAPWPVAPDGNGPTLSLFNPALDNSVAENWRSSLNHGTPAALNDFATGINDDVIVHEYNLLQNYPNPFNPSTTISFSISKPENVEVKVYNLLGQEVATLLNDYREAGRYELRFNAANLSSGVYIYSIKSGDYLARKKMTLLK